MSILQNKMGIRGFLILFSIVIPKLVYSKTFVVAVGIADYAYISDLRLTEKDVEKFIEVMKYHGCETKTLTGTEATRNNVLSTLNSVFSKAKQEDAVILFFSGHGYPGGFCCWNMSANSADGGLSYKDLQVVFKNCKATRKIVFADACYSGGLRTTQKKNDDTYTEVKNNSVMFFLSSRTNEVSKEQSAGGVFTTFLVKGLRGGADANKDRYITAWELYDYVQQNVVSFTHQKQHPVMWGKFNNQMVVIDWNKK